MLETIYICRHGARQDWVDPLATTSATGVYRDPTLSSLGQTQAAHLASFLSAPSHPSSPSQDSSPATPPMPEMIVTSPYYRCVQTSLPLATKLGVPLHLENGVSEWFAPAIEPGTGLYGRPSHSALAPHFPPSTFAPAYTPTYYPSRLGESLDDLTARTEGFLAAFLRRFAAEYPDVKTVLIVAHAATVITLGRALTGNPDLDVSAGVCSTSKYTLSRSPPSPAPAGLGDWQIEWNGRTDYLPTDEPIRSWSFREVKYQPDGSVGDTVGGDGIAHPAGAELPVGIAPGMEMYQSAPATTAA